MSMILEKIKDFLWNRWQTRTIDLAVCTHPDSDHKGGFFDLLRDQEMVFKEFWLNTPDNVIDETEFHLQYPKLDRITHCHSCYCHPNDESEKDLVQLALQYCKEGRVRCVYNGTQHPEIPIRVVGPTKSFYRPLAFEILKGNRQYKPADDSVYEDNGEFSYEQAKSLIDKEDDDISPTNAGCIVLLFEPNPGVKFLFLGDANRDAVEDIIKNNNDVSGCRIKVPHHGSKHNLTSTLIDKLQPVNAIISAKGSRKHPSRGVVYCFSKHCNVYSTHKSGDLYDHDGLALNPAVPLKKKQES